MKKLLAFTLAETLIVIGIIGVVSALTLPNLNSSTGEKEKVAKVKKIYQNLDDAVGRAQAIYGPLDEWFVNDTTEAAQIARFGERITEFMKVSKNCGYSDNNNSCFINLASLKPLRANESTFHAGKSYSFILADGTSVDIHPYSSSESSSESSSDPSSDPSTKIYVDIDGFNRGSNTLGKDVFLFTANFSDGTLLPYWAWSDGMMTLFIRAGGHSAAAWVIKYDNMDYLKTDSSGKCPNGTTLTVSNPRCN